MANWTREQYKAHLDKKPAQSKFKNVKVEVDGCKFDSRKESERYGILKLLEQRGNITNLQRQVTYKLEVNGQLICKYLADFTYEQNGVTVTEDTKSKHTRTLPVYRLKYKLMKAVLGITIKES